MEIQKNTRCCTKKGEEKKRKMRFEEGKETGSQSNLMDSHTQDMFNIHGSPSNTMIVIAYISLLRVKHGA